MFTYKRCKGEKANAHDGGTLWMLTFEDGTHDMAFGLSMAIKLCDKTIRRASF